MTNNRSRISRNWYINSTIEVNRPLMSATMSTTVSPITKQPYLKETGIAMAVHDLKGYLAVISGQAKLLRAGKLGDVTPNQVKALADICSCCSQIEEQIARLLNPGASGGNQWKPVLNKADMRQCLLDVYGLLRPEFAENQLKFDLELSDHAMFLPFDARLIRRVMVNLLENARRFTPAGGQVTLSLQPEFWERRNSRFRAAFNGTRDKANVPNCARIAVSDNGCGIAPRDHEAVFEEYFSTPAPGCHLSSGLGLAIARRIVLAHGGKIWVESAIGKGSRFCFLIPFVPPLSTDEVSAEKPDAEDS